MFEDLIKKIKKLPRITKFLIVVAPIWFYVYNYHLQPKYLVDTDNNLYTIGRVNNLTQERLDFEFIAKNGEVLRVENIDLPSDINVKIGNKIIVLYPENNPKNAEALLYTNINSIDANDLSDSLKIVEYYLKKHYSGTVLEDECKNIIIRN